MPAAAVASFTRAIAGMSGISVGASGEMAVDMGLPASSKGSALYHLNRPGGRYSAARLFHPPLEGEGRFASREARCETGWGDGPSTRAPPERTDRHPTPPLISFASTLPLGRVIYLTSTGALSDKQSQGE